MRIRLLYLAVVIVAALNLLVVPLAFAGNNPPWP
jgi:hypothetical protein